MIAVRLRKLVAGFALGLSLAGGAPAQAADNVRLTGLADVAFGTITATGDQTMSQSVCAFTSAKSEGYGLTATGSGSGGAFTLSSGAAQLPYEVMWSDSSGQTTGTVLAPGTYASGFTSTTKRQICDKPPPATASLIVVIRAANLGVATAGSYTGTLQLTIAPE